MKRVKKLADILIRGYSISKDSMFARIKRGGEYKVFTYSMALEIAKKIGAYLKYQGLKKGDRCAIIGENCPEWGISYFGIQWAGGICVPLDSKATPFEWKQFLNHSESRFVFVSNKCFDKFLEIKNKIKTLQRIITFPEKKREAISFDEIINFEKKLENPIERDPNDLAIILYTSGTTGMPKGVMLSHKNIISNIESIIKVFKIDHNDHIFSVLPLHHIFEGTCGFLTPVYIGAKITYASSLKPNILLEDLKDTEPTVFLTVPLILEKFYLKIKRNIEDSYFKKLIFNFINILDFFTNKKASQIILKGIKKRTGFSKIKYIISGGAPLPEWVAKGLVKLGFPIYQGYGLSETSPVVSVIPPDGKNKLTSVGLPVPGVKVKIFKPDERGIGEIGVKGDIIMLGYYKNKQETERVFKNGWFLTGDLGYVDKDGYLYITGRKKSVIVTKGGKNIYPEEIENLLLTSPFIKECLVIAKNHPETKTEILHAIIYPDFEKINEKAKRKNIKINQEEMNKWIKKEIEKINKKLADYKKIRTFSLRYEEFPKTTTQKIKRYLFESKNE